MNAIVEYLSGAGGLLYFLAPLLLGVIHGIEPLHSKTVLASMIVSTRGGLWQASLLGVSAALSHTLTIWLIAVLASHYGSHWNLGRLQPYFEMFSAMVTLGVAVWIFIRTRRSIRKAEALAIWGGGTADENAETQDFTEEAERVRRSSTAQMLLLGVVTGMMPCPLTLGILMACLQSGRLVLGLAVATCFSIGLALTMVLAAALGAWGMRSVWHFNAAATALRIRAAYLTCLLLAALAALIAIQAWPKFFQP
ncbi:MAG TPA: sulfite exporter TauE/SafE family protein [Prosthecobacter sp.]|nr:sulfite exporter TauE/SafE family protein [Prosthecobacter sp.]